MVISRRDFFKGIGAVSVSLLFRRQLDAALASLENEATREASILVEPAREFRPTRLVVASHVAQLFVIDDIRVDQEPAFSSPVPATLFTLTAIDTRLELGACRRNIRFNVRYVSADPAGARFCATLIGRTVASSAAILPIDSGRVLGV